MRLRAILANHHQAFILVFIVELVEVRDGNAARPAPRRPKLDKIGLALLKFFDRFALHPFAVLDFGSFVADFERGSLTCAGQASHGCDYHQQLDELLRSICFHISSPGVVLESFSRRYSLTPQSRPAQARTDEDDECRVSSVE